MFNAALFFLNQVIDYRDGLCYIIWNPKLLTFELSALPIEQL